MVSFRFAGARGSTELAEVRGRADSSVVVLDPVRQGGRIAARAAWRSPVAAATRLRSAAQAGRGEGRRIECCVPEAPPRPPRPSLQTPHEPRLAEHDQDRSLAANSIKSYCGNRLRNPKIVEHSRYMIFQLAEVAVPRVLFEQILTRIRRLRPIPI